MVKSGKNFTSAEIVIGNTKTLQVPIAMSNTSVSLTIIFYYCVSSLFVLSFAVTTIECLSIKAYCLKISLSFFPELEICMYAHLKSDLLSNI
jgi:hypothetical protein